MAKSGRFSSAIGISLGIHTILFVLVIYFMGLRPEQVDTKAPPIRTELVYLQHAGPGGGGGGNPAPAPPKPMQIPPHEIPAVPVVATTVPIDPPKPFIDASVQTNMATVLQASGTNLLAPPGPGGGGRGTGAGPGDGPGVGPGRGGNNGGGLRQIGDGVTSPTVKLEVHPIYTNGAMQARIVGSVTVEAVVRADGTVGDVKVVVSLDKIHGLDEEAIKAAKKWLFNPGMFEGKAVDVLVRIVLAFNLR